ncbi:MAG: acyltransferase [Bacteroidia bacterium]|nr:acyltransferase [Bacteroidia bacterium]
MYLLNSAFNLVDTIYWKLNGFLFTTFQSAILRLKGIRFGKQIKFYGNPTFKRASSAHILIGDHCTFRSASNSNLIGINRPCIVSAMADKANLRIGNNCGFSGTVIGCFKEITIGDNVKCGANTLITDSDWHLDDPRSGNPKPIVIHNNVWLGVNVIVLKGVIIGENSVIGAGSVVTKDIPANVIAGGNPCKTIKLLRQ